MKELLKRDSAVPLYYQLSENLRKRIHSDWPTGSQIPTEKQIADQYGVSLITVRQALSDLVDEGLIERQRGRGTFVAPPKITHGMVQLASFTEEQGALGKRVTAQVLDLKTDLPTPREAELLEIPLGETVTRFSRIRFVDGEPMMVAYTTLINEVGRHLNEEVLQGSFYSFLRSIRWPLARATEEVQADFASAREAALLKISRRTPVLRTRRVAYTAEGLPFEVTVTVASANRVRIYLNLYANVGARDGE